MARNRWLRVTGAMAAAPSRAAIIGSDFWMQEDFELDPGVKVLRFFLPLRRPARRMAAARRRLLPGPGQRGGRAQAAGSDEDRRCAAHRAVARWYALRQDSVQAKAVEQAGQAACAALQH